MYIGVAAVGSKLSLGVGYGAPTPHFKSARSNRDWYDDILRSLRSLRMTGVCRRREFRRRGRPCAGPAWTVTDRFIITSWSPTALRSYLAKAGDKVGQTKP